MEDLKIGFAHTLNAFHCSVAFMLLFTTYNAVQNLSSSFYDGSLGYWSIATTYISLCLCSFFVAGPLVMKLGSKYSMILGFCFYFLFLLANKFASFYTLIPAASLTGFGSSLVWVGQGSYITACAINYSKVRNHLSPKGMI